MLPYYIYHNILIYLSFGTLYKALAYYWIVRFIDSSWFGWVSQCNHIPMDIHDDVPNDTWLHLQVIY